jgi:hypothetical protein
MDNTTPMYVDKTTGTYGEQKDLIMVNLSAGELYRFESMSDSEIISYCKAVEGVHV